jgi:tRNA threonylcarbamoyladenosine biosynthesis protein TsaB
MTVLAIDTASRRRALCIVAGAHGQVVAAQPLPGRDLDRQLLPALAALLGDDVEAVACVLGPGSYTGLRVGIAAALGVAHARDLPLHGIDALDAVARTAPADAAEIEAVADAGRGALYVGRYRREGDEFHLTEPARRVEAGEWQPASHWVAVSLDGIPGTLDGSPRAAEALAAAAAAALAQPPLPRTGLEPVYLTGSGSAPARPRV